LRRRRRTLPAIVLPESGAAGAIRPSAWARLWWLPGALVIAALVLTSIGLAGPRFRASRRQDLSVEGIDIVVAFDLSTSMLAADFRPKDRITVAKEVLRNFIGSRPNDRIGLVVFAGEAYTQCPLTLDHKVLEALLDQVRTGVIVDGTAIGNALGTAVNRLRESEAKSRVVILITDGDTLNRASRGFAFAGSGGPSGLDQLIGVLNRERRNDRLYVGLFMPSPTILWEDKELPNIPLSQINVIDGRPTPGSVQVLRESLASESSVPLGGPVSGVISLNLQIR